ncbi:replication initiator protein A [Candidatus Pantoea edessiphila]|nr:replication initiator protein A [Candidatus Pantoea edessiphila]
MIRSSKQQIDFFIADEVEISGFRDDISSMEYPFFALRGGDKKIRKYETENVIIKIKPNVDGVATIFDKDIWIYSISKLQAAINNNSPISRTITFTPYDFFITTNREKGGRAYSDFKKSLSKLAGTRIETNVIYSDSKRELVGFGLIDSWRIIDEKRGKLSIGMVEITLPNWLYQALHKKKILKISPDYFSIRKAIDRRIYEIARKHCGNQEKFSISLKNLHLKTGSTSLLKMFRYNFKKLVKVNNLPNYTILYDEKTDIVMFSKRVELNR